MDSLFPGWREATDEWVKLRKELAAEQAARVQAEQELEGAREAVVRTANDLNATIGGLSAELEQAEAERDDALKAAAEYSDHLDGYGTLVGPCPHGRDPWDRCDTCGELNAVQVALLLRDAEKDTRERAEARRRSCSSRRSGPPRSCATPTASRRTGTSWRAPSTSWSEPRRQAGNDS